MRFELQKQLGRFCIYDTWAMGGPEVCMYFDHAYEEQALMALRIFNEYENHKNNALRKRMFERLRDEENGKKEDGQG